MPSVTEGPQQGAAYGGIVLDEEQLGHRATVPTGGLSCEGLLRIRELLLLSDNAVLGKHTGAWLM
ncbi:hypothetical protein GCM10009838_61540 [Catenulispora subtropica]|uniref:Uncharacterized protein n=1 Tax=Catenulispora subtropica TaxID=450798 RepID=A0ABP5E3D3_9ACTN